jgi:hypothetical protein
MRQAFPSAELITQSLRTVVIVREIVSNADAKSYVDQGVVCIVPVVRHDNKTTL